MAPAEAGTTNVPLCGTHAVDVECSFRHRWEADLGDLTESYGRRVKEEREAKHSVYYMLAKNGRVKIGFSGWPEGRRSQLQVYFGPLEILATEDGGRAKERERHDQFASTRIGRTEWFDVSDELRGHIKSLQPPKREKRIIRSSA